MLYIPLITGLLLPIATFLNFQAITAPGWLSFSEDESGFIFKLARPHEPADSVTYVRQKEALVLCSLSFICGLVSVVSLFLRMLEKKIKWTTRLFIIGAYGQGCLSLILALFFILTLFTSQKAYQFAEGLVYTLLCSLLSLTTATLAHYQQYLNREQIYVYIQNELSAAQRQLMLLSISTFSYLALCSLVYSVIEGWDIDDGLYWAVVTLATIGFGDVVPKTVLGKALLPLMASCGIVVIAGHIYAIRNVLLEMITYSLASQFSKKFGHERLKPNSHRLSLQDSFAHIDGMDGYYSNSTEPLYSSPAIFPYQIVPASDDFQNHHHSNYDALDLASQESNLGRVASLNRIAEQGTGSVSYRKPIKPMSPLLLPDPRIPCKLESSLTDPLLPPPTLESIPSRSTSRQELTSRMINIKRSDILPQMYIHTTSEASRHEQHSIILQVTQQTFRRQVVYAALAVILNMLLFGGIFAWIENWSFFEGVYFSYVALMTIGFGDYSLTTVQSRSLFIWHVFAGIASITYFSSMVAERAMNQWTVQVAKIEKRVDRYTQKATLKKLYKRKEPRPEPPAEPAPPAVATSAPRPPRRTSSVFYRNGNLANVPNCAQLQDKKTWNHGTVQVEAPYSMSVPSSWNFTTTSNRLGREKRYSAPLMDSTDDEEYPESWDGSSDDGPPEGKGKHVVAHSPDPSSSRLLGWDAPSDLEKQPLLKE